MERWLPNYAAHPRGATPAQSSRGSENRTNEGNPRSTANEGIPRNVASEGIPRHAANEPAPRNAPNEGSPRNTATEYNSRKGANEDNPRNAANEGAPSNAANQPNQNRAGASSIGQARVRCITFGRSTDPDRPIDSHAASQTLIPTGARPEAIFTVRYGSQNYELLVSSFPPPQALGQPHLKNADIEFLDILDQIFQWATNGDPAPRISLPGDIAQNRFFTDVLHMFAEVVRRTCEKRFSLSAALMKPQTIRLQLARSLDSFDRAGEFLVWDTMEWSDKRWREKLVQATFLTEGGVGVNSYTGRTRGPYY